MLKTELVNVGTSRAIVRETARSEETDGHYGDAADDYAMLSDKDAAFAALEKASPNRSGVFIIKSDPKLDSIRSDPRYADLLRRIELPQYWEWAFYVAENENLF